jgi:hypothetical protein
MFYSESLAKEEWKEFKRACKKAQTGLNLDGLEVEPGKKRSTLADELEG